MVGICPDLIQNGEKKSSNRRSLVRISKQPKILKIKKNIVKKANFSVTAKKNRKDSFQKALKSKHLPIW